MSTRIIMHIDMNSYFASCEQQDRPAWRGRPLGVCEHLGGVIIAPSVEAKRWGVKTGMPVWEAKTLCPQIILTRTNPDRYRFYTTKFYTLLEEYTDLLEKYSIDEAFLDLTKVCNIKSVGIRSTHMVTVEPFKEAERIALEIKKRIKQEVGDWLRCSVGIAWNKLVAKIASDLEKPDGLVVVRPGDKELLYVKLKLTDIPGIASQQAKRLAMYGIRTLRDLQSCPESHLVAWFGIPGRHLWLMGQLEGFFGEGFKIQPLKSIGHMYTIAKEHRKNSVTAQNVLARLCEFLARRLRNLNFLATHLTVLVVGTESQVVVGYTKMGDGISTGRGLVLASLKVLDRYGGFPAEVVRVGVTASKLIPGSEQVSLFTKSDKSYRLALAMDKVNIKYSGGYDWNFAQTKAGLGDTPAYRGQDVLLPAKAFFARQIIRDSIGFGRVREMEDSQGLGIEE